MTVFLHEVYTSGSTPPSGSDVGLKTVAGVQVAGSTYAENDGVAYVSFAPPTSDDFMIKVVGGPYGLISDTTAGYGILFHMTKSGSGSYYAGLLGENLHVADDFAQTNTGIGWLSTYSVASLATNGVTVILQLTKVDANTSNLTITVYSDTNLTTVYGTATNIGSFNVESSTVTGFYVPVDNPDLNPTGAFLREMSMYTPDEACFFETSLIDTLRGPVMVADLTTEDIVFDYQNKPSQVVKVWKSKFPGEFVCYRFGNVLVTDQHLIQRQSDWVRADHGTQLREAVRGYLYQVQTASYGLKSSGEVFSTWTQQYLDEHLIEMV